MIKDRRRINQWWLMTIDMFCNIRHKVLKSHRVLWSSRSMKRKYWLINIQRQKYRRKSRLLILSIQKKRMIGIESNIRIKVIILKMLIRIKIIIVIIIIIIIMLVNNNTIGNRIITTTTIIIQIINMINNCIHSLIWGINLIDLIVIIIWIKGITNISNKNHLINIIIINMVMTIINIIMTLLMIINLWQFNKIMNIIVNQLFNRMFL